jgi:hypothetical protein
MADVLILIDQQEARFDASGFAVPARAGGQRLPAADRAASGRDGGDQEGAERLHRHRPRGAAEGHGESAPDHCGVLLANSVEAAVRVAVNLGFTVRLPADACWSCDKRDLSGRLWPAEDVHQLTLALFGSEYAAVTTVDAILAG